MNLSEKTRVKGHAEAVIHGRIQRVVQSGSHEAPIFRVFCIGMLVGITMSITAYFVPEELAPNKFHDIFKSPFVKAIVIGLLSVLAEYIFRKLRQIIKDS